MIVIRDVRVLVQWLERRRTRRALLETPGVDLLVRRVMDERYGKHNWRVRDDMLEALVILPGQKEPWWGPIGPLHARTTRIWLRDGASGVSHAKLPDDLPCTRAPEPLECVYPGPYKVDYYKRSYEDTEPSEDDRKD